MAYSLHPATNVDVEDMARTFQAAFAADAIISLFHPHTPKHLLWEEDVKLFSNWISEGPKFGSRMTKVVEQSTGELVAFSKWDYPKNLTPELREEKERKKKERNDIRPMEGSNVELIDDFFAQLNRGREKWIVEGETFFLHILAVHPSHQRRGLGTLLVEPGLAAADAAGKKAYIEASPKGLGLYKKHGWVECDEMVVDLEKHGGKGVQVQKFLIREPGAGRRV